MEFKRTAGEWVFDILNHLIMIVLVIIKYIIMSKKKEKMKKGFRCS